MNARQLLLGLGASGCVGSPAGSGDGPRSGEAAELTINGSTPTQGPAAGGVLVTVQGSGFQDASELTLDGAPCENLVVLSSVELTCLTPDLSMESLETRTAWFRLVRLDDGQEAELEFVLVAGEGGDTGLVTDTGSTDTGPASDTGGHVPREEDPLDYCHLQWPCSLSSVAGESTENIYTWVYELDATEGVGQGPGILVELGLGPDGATEMAQFTWSEAGYFADKDGLTSGDLANDEYVGSLTPEDPGDFDIWARVSADEGATWTLCDLGGEGCSGLGSGDGYSPDASIPLVVAPTSL